MLAGAIAGSLAAAGAEPLADQHASGPFRVHLAAVMARRALARALSRAEGQAGEARMSERRTGGVSSPGHRPGDRRRGPLGGDRGGAARGSGALDRTRAVRGRRGHPGTRAGDTDGAAWGCPGTLHAFVVRSPVAHARIASVDVSGARAADGVVAVLTAADLDAAGVGPMPGGEGMPAGALNPPFPVLASAARWSGRGSRWRWWWR